MLVLGIRTDKPEAELSLLENGKVLAAKNWHAHRELATTLHIEISNLLRRCGKDLQNLQGIVGFEGPGSFTGLRIGLSVANALAYGLEIPIVGSRGDDWAAQGFMQLEAGVDVQTVLPHYGAEVHITPPRQV